MIDFKGLKQIDLTKENVYDDFNKKLDAKNTWNSLTQKLKRSWFTTKWPKKYLFILQIALLQSRVKWEKE